MLEVVIPDLREFVFVLGTIVMGFAFALFFNNYGTDVSEFGFHDDGAGNPFWPFANIIQSVFLFAFVQEMDYDAYKHTPVNITIFTAFVLAIGASAGFVSHVDVSRATVT